MDDPLEHKRRLEDAAELAAMRRDQTFRDPGFHLRDLQLPELPVFVNPVTESIEANQASEFHKRLMAWINGFDAKLDQAHEVGVRLVSFGQTVTFHLTAIGYWNPSLISFTGETHEGEPVELIQHVSQISVLLMKLPRRDATKPKRPIGFHAEAIEKPTPAAP